MIMTDAANHGFSLKKEQTVTPIKCRRVVDSASGETTTVITKVIGAPDST